jgi:membrane fusion protein, multidrug efflux system
MNIPRKLLYALPLIVALAAVAIGSKPGPDAKAAESDKKPAAQAPRPMNVEVARAEPQTVADDAQTIGTLRATRGIMLRPEVAGRIIGLGFQDGAAVQQGQLLVQLDDSLQRAELQQAKAQVAIAEANFGRNKELLAQGFVSQRMLDESSANLQVAQAQAALAQARLARMALRAPFSGVMGLKQVSVGDYVRDGADLVQLQDLRQLELDFRLPEAYQQKIRKGQMVQLRIDALQGRSFEAKIQATDPLLDANGRSVNVRAVVGNGSGALRPGMFARVTTVFAQNAEALWVPEAAIVPQGGKQFVIKIVAAKGTAEPASAGMQWLSQRQQVELGARQNGRVEVRSGLSQGEQVVVAGQQRLQRDGTPVRIIEAR